MADPVRQWDPQIARAHKQYPDVPEWMMRSLIFHESGGQLNAVNSSFGAFGLTQFIPSTAAAYGVKPGDAQSQVTGMAHYLHALNVGKSPAKALNSYGGGDPAYYSKLLQIAKSHGYHTAGDGTVAPAGASSGSAGAGTGGATPGAGAGGGSDTSGIVKAIVRVALVIGGAVTAGIGISRLTGLRAGTAIAKTALAAAK